MWPQPGRDGLILSDPSIGVNQMLLLHGVGFHAAGRSLAAAVAEAATGGLRALSVLPLIEGAVASIHGHRLVRFMLRDRGLVAHVYLCACFVDYL